MNTLTVPASIVEHCHGRATARVAQELVLSPEAESYLSQADSAYKNGELSAACDLLQQGLSCCPQSGPLLMCLGNIQFQTGDYPAALQSFQSARELDANDTKVLVRLAMAAAHCGQTETYKKNMARVFELDSENADALRFVAKLNMEQENYKLAAQQYRRLLHQCPDELNSLLHAGHCLVKTNDRTSATEMFERALRLDPANAIAMEKLKTIKFLNQIAATAQAAKSAPAASPAQQANRLEALIQEIRHDKIGRPNYAHGLLLATLQAMKVGVKQISVFEFGVASGDGLLNLCSICQRITEASGFQFKIYGFDSDIGMPEVTDYRDHPEIWYTGQFKVDHALTQSKLPENGKLIVGDIAKTIVPFCKENLSAECPVGFVSIDVDLYSSTKSAFKLFKGKPECYLPAVVMYFDDVNDMITLNSWCGEALAIKEFNRANKFRKIEEKWTRQNTCNSGWHDHMYCCHVLDHPVRSGKMKCASLDLNVTIY